MSKQRPKTVEIRLPPRTRIAIAAARFNGPIVDHLLADCVDDLRQAGIAEKNMTVIRVPGAFELPLAAKMLCQTRRYAAVICLGAVIRGQTPHFELVASNCADGIRQVSLEFSVPVIFGVLATNTEKQAWDRTRGPHSHTGASAAAAAREMISLLHQITFDNFKPKTSTR